MCIFNVCIFEIGNVVPIDIWSDNYCKVVKPFAAGLLKLPLSGKSACVCVCPPSGY